MQGETLGEVVVTGTLIRGIAPAGAEVVGVDKEQIQASGAVTATDILSTIPQVTSQFNQFQLVGTTTSTQVQVSRPNLRDLPGAQSGNSTLVLVDGHRIASAGVTQFAPDPDVVPPSILDHVEIVPDGGSATYGTDAVGGVINFITKRRLDGVHFDAKVGLTNHYNQENVDIAVGKTWDTGSAYIAYDFQHNTPLFARYRDFIRGIDWNTGIPYGRSCTPANIAIGGVNYAYPGLAPGSINACDTQRSGTYYPRQSRNSVFAGLSQDFGERVKFDVKAFYTKRDTWSSDGPATASAAIPSTNPYYVNVPSAPGRPQTVSFNFGPVYGNNAIETSRLKEWGITPTVSVDLDHDWQVRGMVNFGGSDTSYFDQSVNPGLLSQYGAATTASAALNPYNIAATNPQLLSNLLDYALAAESKVTLINTRVIADGKLFTLPGGDVRLAFGVEYLRNHLSTRSAGGGETAADYAATPFTDYTQAVTSAFGELQVPIVGPDNAFPGVHSFAISASARFDHYSDFGNTENPKVGLTWEPVDWVKIRASWGTSFNAPTPVDQLGSLANTLLALPFVIPAPGVPAAPGSWLIALEGSEQNLKPQTAEQWSVGGDFKWPFASGLTSSVTAYSIDYRGLLSRPPVFNPSIFFPSFPGFYTLHPTAAQISALAAQVKGGAAQVAQFLQPGGPPVYELLEYVTANLGSAETRGLDFSTRYRRATDFGGVDASVGGNWEFLNETTLGPGIPPSDTLRGGDPRLRLSTTLGADIHQLRAEMTVYHTASAKVIYSAGLPQDSIPAFNVVNLFFKYTLNGEDWRKNMFFTVNVDNLLNAAPPLYRIANGNGTTNGQTLGRLLQFGVHKDF